MYFSAWSYCCKWFRFIQATMAFIDFILKILVNMVLFRYCGWRAIVYIATSSAFSMGLLCHPCIAFWIMQHACNATSENYGQPSSIEEWNDVLAAASVGCFQFHTSVQPTMSYYGSRLWNWLTLNELLHVEHHDFSGIPWTRLQSVTALLPNMYKGEDMGAFFSLYGDIIFPWITTCGVKYDFACRNAIQWQIAGRVFFVRQTLAHQKSSHLSPRSVSSQHSSRSSSQRGDCEDATNGKLLTWRSATTWHTYDTLPKQQHVLWRQCTM